MTNIQRATFALCALAALALLGGCPDSKSGNHEPATQTNMGSSMPAMQRSIPGTHATGTDAASAQAAATADKHNPVVIPAGLTESSFKVEGMDCADCSSALEQALIKLPGVTTVAADWKGGSVKVQYDALKCKPADIVAAVNKMQYKCKISDEPMKASGAKPANKQGA